MSFRILYFLSIFNLSLCMVACHRQPAVSPLPVIWDTDIGPDFDDAGAGVMLHQLADEGKINLLATVACNTYPNSTRILQVFNGWYGRPQLPVGKPDSAYAPLVPDNCHWTDSVLAHFPVPARAQATVQDAVMLYRRLLAAAADHSVVIVSTGFFSNLAALLHSGPDSYVQDSGIQLVRTKVKYLVSMAGSFPQGREFNVYQDVQAAAYVADHWPTPVIFCGFEIGDSVFTGIPLLRPDLPLSPIRQTFRIGLHCWHEESTGHPSWDETAVLAASDTLHQLFDWHPGHIRIYADGTNAWENEPKGNQYYLVLKTSRAHLAKLIDDYLLRK